MKTKTPPRKPLRSPDLLTAERFQAAVLYRDRHRCVFCQQKALGAYHIIEQRAFPTGGFYLENGAALCEQHRQACDMTLISVDDVRSAAGIETVCVPPDWYEDEKFDRWGNLYLPTGMRSKGELFYDPAVQRLLKMGGVLDQFTDLQKYPRTLHVSWSEGVQDDDRVIASMDAFVGKWVVVTEKMDGENSTLMQQICHARSLDSRHHSSRDWLKNFWAKFKHEIPLGWRICGENLYAQHSIRYKLDTYFHGFNIWNEMNYCLSWADTLEYFDLLGIKPVKVLYEGIYDEEKIKALYNSKEHWESCEGYVIRVAEAFHLSQFRNVVAKFVRAGHVQTGKHWLYDSEVKPNELV